MSGVKAKRKKLQLKKKNLKNIKDFKLNNLKTNTIEKSFNLKNFLKKKSTKLNKKNLKSQFEYSLF